MDPRRRPGQRWCTPRYVAQPSTELCCELVHYVCIKSLVVTELWLRMQRFQSIVVGIYRDLTIVDLMCHNLPHIYDACPKVVHGIRVTIIIFQLLSRVHEQNSVSVISESLIYTNIPVNNMNINKNPSLCMLLPQ